MKNIQKVIHNPFYAYPSLLIITTFYNFLCQNGHDEITCNCIFTVFSFIKNEIALSFPSFHRCLSLPLLLSQTQCYSLWFSSFSCAFTYHSFSHTFHIIMIDKTPYQLNLTPYYTQKINRVQVTTYNSTTAIYLSDGSWFIIHDITMASFHYICVYQWTHSIYIHYDGARNYFEV